ncbi:MAG: helicase-exonuclease AddAB subunit AddA [Planctomycetota bacterium]
MPDLTFTPEQRQAIETIDRSVLVSAAAGSGKTAVLAERCAYLVCDAPPEQRCDIDQLVVVTFTENAAAEMKARIRAAIHGRFRRHPHDARLRSQLALLDHARISTLHAFGLWILRRWFGQAGVDPAAPVLDEHEAALLRSEALDRLLEALYAEDSDLGIGFRKLVDDYGLGRDSEIRRFVQQLAGFLESLPDPEGWLVRCLEVVTADRPRLLVRLAGDLVEELEGQADYCRRAARHIEHHLSEFVFYGRLLDEATHLLEEWRLDLGDAEDVSASVARVQAAIGAHRFHAKGAPQVAKDAPAERHARRERARLLYTHFKEKLFQGRLQRIFGRFTSEEWCAGLDCVAPYVEIITQLTERFRRDYAQTKSEAGVLDFADLERKVYELLVRHADIAGSLRQRFHHVLVDEFQDINPLQEAIIRLVSREPDAGLPDNLFVVGDVKQSIYRFRLAEPAIFLARQAALSREDSAGACIYLQRNFRSAAPIIDGVNHLFRRLLTRQVGGIAYDASAELRAGREPEVGSGKEAANVELHLLQRRWAAETESDAEFVDANDPAEWSVIEREAYIVAQRIRQILTDGMRKRDGAPLGYGDVAVLLRAAAHTAAPMAQRLSALGIPAGADVGGEFFSALEVREVLALLSVLDNQRQDTPLAAVLRSPVLGDALNEDELLELRLIDRDVPFHETVPRYAVSGPDRRLRERVARLLNRIDGYRSDARQRPLSETLWRIYHAHGYLAYVGGLPNGAGRRANLLKLHEYARRFGTFQRQGLHRFLRFIESLAEQGRDLDTSPSPLASESVVRVMSIHRSKGLEFPVVVLADLGRRFNLSDAAGRLIFDRELGLGVRAVDRERMIEYPSLAHHLVANCVNQHTRAEELRILYVALTRAMQRLILVGSADLDVLRRSYALHVGADGPLSRLTLRMAATPLDWIVPALATLPRDAVRWHTSAERDPYAAGSGAGRTGGDRPGDGRVEAPVFTVHAYEENEMAGWALEISAPSSEESARQAAAALLPLPAEEPIEASEEAVAPILNRLAYVYPHLVAASVPAVVAATELRKRYAWLHDPDERPVPVAVDWVAGPPPPTPRGGLTARGESGQERCGTGILPVETQAGRLCYNFCHGLLRSPVLTGRDRAAEAGLATHRLLQYLDLKVSPDPESLRHELHRLVNTGLLASTDAAAVDLEAVAWFLGTELGTRIRASGADYRREVMFVHRRPASAIDPWVVGPEPPPSRGEPGSGDESGDVVLVRGVIDGVLATDSGVEVVDYKTDRITAAEVDERARRYAPQLAAYAAAAEALFNRPAERSWLVFLEGREVVQVHAQGQ